MFYKIARKLRDLKAVEKAVKTKSLKPLVKRAGNKMIGKLMNRMWIK